MLKSYRGFEIENLGARKCDKNLEAVELKSMQCLSPTIGSYLSYSLDRNLTDNRNVNWMLLQFGDTC